MSLLGFKNTLMSVFNSTPMTSTTTNTKTHSGSPINPILPKELMIVVFSFLDPHFLCKTICLVHSSFYDLCMSNEFWFFLLKDQFPDVMDGYTIDLKKAQEKQGRDFSFLQFYKDNIRVIDPVSGWIHDSNSYLNDKYGENHLILHPGSTNVKWDSNFDALFFKEGYLSRYQNVKGLNFGRKSFSITAWIKTPQQQGARILSCRNKFEASVEFVVPRWNTGRTSIFIGDGFQNYHYDVGSKNVNDNLWHFCCMVIDRYKSTTKLKSYVDGVNDGTFKLDCTLGDINIDKFLCLGHYRGINKHQFEGHLKHVNIYKYALTDQQVRTLYYTHRNLFVSNK